MCSIGLSSSGIQVGYVLVNRHIHQLYNVLPHYKYNLLNVVIIFAIYNNTKKHSDLPTPCFYSVKFSARV